ncbi:hypothetical protein [Hymenobacter psychrophilus]|uniref:Uncharacterized protein n=1 Tax=Hymenobacter psychrophilus TaxID=651662 RepID=A0A1H3GSS6_9BACT|nr:hypothetical protein [Hymenobacter psychrophilus]SDY05708.1 hypothetical protein SAMN04488069_105136 [Hymenobacter psychrophilus]
MSGFPSAPDSFQKKTTAELQYLVENPSLYDAGVVTRARQELRQRGALVPATPSLPNSPAAPVSTAYDHDDAPPSQAGSRWLLGGLGLLAVLALAWWAFQPQPAKTAVRQPPAPIVLEATTIRPLPSFEPEAAKQVATTRRLLPATDRADTTAAGRYARMARRYWLAENTAAYLTAQALGDSVTSVFAGQAGIGLERISWFMGAMAYDQNLTPEMDTRLALMQRGMALRRSSLQALKARAEADVPLLDPDVERDQQEAVSVSREVLGQYQKAAPIRGRLEAL